MDTNETIDQIRLEEQQRIRVILTRCFHTAAGMHIDKQFDTDAIHEVWLAAHCTALMLIELNADPNQLSEENYASNLQKEHAYPIRILSSIEFNKLIAYMEKSVEPT